MKPIIVLTFFLFFGLGAFAQYGKLEPLDNTNNKNFYVLRTSPDSINKLIKSTDKVQRAKGQYIDVIENQLERARQGYLSLRLPTIDVQVILKAIKYLEDKGVDVNYYIEEYFFYYPRRK